jgi:hypothetical protein
MQRVFSVGYGRAWQLAPFVPAEAGTQNWAKEGGPRFRGDARRVNLAIRKTLELLVPF